MSHMGRLEVNYNGEWGTVCVYSFNDIAADVVCKSLGYRYVAYSIFYNSIVTKVSEYNTRTQDAAVVCISLGYGLVLVWYIHLSVNEVNSQCGHHAALQLVGTVCGYNSFTHTGDVCKSNSVVFGLASVNTTVQKNKKNNAVKLNSSTVYNVGLNAVRRLSH